MRSSEIAGVLCFACVMSFSLSAQRLGGQGTIGVSVKNDQRQLNGKEIGMLENQASTLLENQRPWWGWRENSKGTVANLVIELVIAADLSETSYMLFTLSGVLDPTAVGSWKEDHLFPRKLTVMPRDEEWRKHFNPTLTRLLSGNVVQIEKVLRKILVCKDVDYPADGPPWKERPVFGVLPLQWPGEQAWVGSTAFGIKADDGTSETPIFAFATGHPMKFTKAPNAYQAVAVKLTHVNNLPVSDFNKSFQGWTTKGVFWNGNIVTDPKAP